MQDHELEYQKSMLGALEKYVKDVWVEYQKAYPAADIYSTSIADFMEFMKMEQDEYLKRIS